MTNMCNHDSFTACGLGSVTNAAPPPPAPSCPGETIAECAQREILEETGIRLRVHAGTGAGGAGAGGAPDEGFSTCLRHPTPFAAADGIHRDGAGRVLYHYAIIEVRYASDILCEPLSRLKRRKQTKKNFNAGNNP